MDDDEYHDGEMVTIITAIDGEDEFWEGSSSTPFAD